MVEIKSNIDPIIKFALEQFEKMPGSAHAYRIARIAHHTVNRAFTLILDEDNIENIEQEREYIHEVEKRVIDALLAHSKKATPEYIEVLKQEFENSEIRYGLKD
jgi:DNA-binding transcriptional regulator YhcF (GntR family)